MDAGGTPVQALDGLPPVLRHRRVPPDLRHRRRTGALTGRACPPPGRTRRSPTLGFTHLQFEALLTTARQSANQNGFALVAMLGLLGLRIFEATSADIGDLGEEHGHRVLRVCGKGGKVVLVPLPPAVGRAIDRAVNGRDFGPVPAQQPQHANGPACGHAAAPAARRDGGSPDSPASSTYAPAHVRHHYLDAGVDLRDVQIAARHADPAPGGGVLRPGDLPKMMYLLVLDLAADGVPCRGDLPGAGLFQAGVLCLAQEPGPPAGLGRCAPRQRRHRHPPGRSGVRLPVHRR